MKIKKILILLLLVLFFQQCAYAQKTTMEKFQRGADIYFKITDRLDLSLNQQRKAFGIKLEESYHLAPLMVEIKEKEAMLENENLTPGQLEQLKNDIAIKKAMASQKKRYYISRYRGILNEEQNHKLDELIFDIANGYLKL